jgi:putative nucleotidyltransferase with HDIG domain
MTVADIYRIMPEHLFITDENLRKNCAETWLDVIETGGWEEKGIFNCPVVVKGLSKKAPFNDIDHIRSVAKVSIAICDALLESEAAAGTLDRDSVIAGALLHDIGNFVEIDFDGREAAVKPLAAIIPHPCSGAWFAYKHNIPLLVVHIILAHSDLFSPEGVNSCKTREAMIVKYADCLSFYHLQMFYGKE